MSVGQGTCIRSFVPHMRDYSIHVTTNIIKESSLDRNRTCIWSFGNSYTIHCTTRPEKCANMRMCGFANWLSRSNRRLLNQSVRIGCKDLYGNGEQNYAKK